MLYWLTALSDGGDIFNLFRYITFRAGGAFMTALIFGFIFGQPLINVLRRRQGKTVLKQALAAKSAQEWEGLLNAHGIPAGRILTVPEILAHPQIAARDLLQDLPMPDVDFGGVRVVRAGFDLADSQPAARCPPPWLGQHNADIYASLGRDDAALARLKASGAI